MSNNISQGLPATTADTRLRHLPVDRQVSGAFDGGRITERKPIGFPQEFPPIGAVGPLLYWAWAKSESGGLIGLHPHHGFEITSFCISGEMSHRDSAGNESRLEAGGVQIMQTGSGVAHEESVSADGSFFQIWFHPDLAKTMSEEPRYFEMTADEVPDEQISDGVALRRIIGPQAPVTLQTDATMERLDLDPGRKWSHSLAPGRALAAVAFEGVARWSVPTAQVVAATGDLVVAEAAEALKVDLEAGDDGSRVLVIEVPLSTDYRLHV